LFKKVKIQLISTCFANLLKLFFILQKQFTKTLEAQKNDPFLGGSFELKVFF